MTVSRRTLARLATTLAATAALGTALPAFAADPRVKFVTSEGDFVIEVYPDKAPKTVANFLQYVKDKHYDGTIFHRVIKNFMVQGGGFDKDYKQKPTRAPVQHEGRAAVAKGTCPNAAGFLEGAFACKQTGTAIVIGWALHDPDVPVWLEDDEGHVTPLEGTFRRYRQDVIDSVGQAFPQATELNAGFIALAPDFKLNARVRLKTVSEAGVHIISETGCSDLSADPRQAARNLFSVYAPMQDLHQRITQIDDKLLGPIIAFSQSRWEHLPQRVKHLG